MQEERDINERGILAASVGLAIVFGMGVSLMVERRENAARRTKTETSEVSRERGPGGDLVFHGWRFVEEGGQTTKVGRYKAECRDPAPTACTRVVVNGDLFCERGKCDGTGWGVTTIATMGCDLAEDRRQECIEAKVDGKSVCRECW